jgi:hypothetical protein
MVSGRAPNSTDTDIRPASMSTVGADKDLAQLAAARLAGT